MSDATHKRDLTRAQIKNLGLLATYLENLPEGYRHFGMAGYNSLEDEDEYTYAINNGGLEKFACGTVACAVGHGPSAGVLFRKGVEAWAEPSYWQEGDFNYDVDWDKYSERFAPNSSQIWVWLFGGSWSECDNTHRGAAARIRYILDGKEVPLNNHLFGISTCDPDPELVALYAPYLIKGDGHIKSKSAVLLDA